MGSRQPANLLYGQRQAIQARPWQIGPARPQVIEQMIAVIRRRLAARLKVTNIGANTIKITSDGNRSMSLRLVSGPQGRQLLARLPHQGQDPLAPLAEQVSLGLEGHLAGWDIAEVKQIISGQRAIVKAGLGHSIALDRARSGEKIEASSMLISPQRQLAIIAARALSQGQISRAEYLQLLDGQSWSSDGAVLLSYLTGSALGRRALWGQLIAVSYQVG